MNTVLQIFDITIISLVVVALIANGVPMTLIKGNPVCLFSGFTGTITKEHLPVKDAKVIRSYEWNNKKTVEETVTDENGQFSFESAWVTSRKVFEIQFVSHQEMFVEYDGGHEQIWGGGKGLEEEFTEFGGKPLNLSCNLGDEISPAKIDFGLVGTNCRWDIEEGTKINYRQETQE